MLPWFYLFLAGLFEVGWAVGLKYTEGFTRLWPSIGTASSMIVSLLLLGIALRDLPLGTAYAVWVGIGIIGTVIFGMVYLGDSASLVRIGCIALILAGVAGLKVTT